MAHPLRQGMSPIATIGSEYLIKCLLLEEDYLAATHVFMSRPTFDLVFERATIVYPMDIKTNMQLWDCSILYVPVFGVISQEKMHPFSVSIN